MDQVLHHLTAFIFDPSSATPQVSIIGAHGTGRALLPRLTGQGGVACRPAGCRTSDESSHHMTGAQSPTVESLFSGTTGARPSGAGKQSSHGGKNASLHHRSDHRLRTSDESEEQETTFRVVPLIIVA